MKAEELAQVKQSENKRAPIEFSSSSSSTIEKESTKLETFKKQQVVDLNNNSKNNSSKSAEEMSTASDKNHQATSYLCAATLESQSKRRRRKQERDACVDGLVGFFASIEHSGDFSKSAPPPPANSAFQQFNMAPTINGASTQLTAGKLASGKRFLEEEEEEEEDERWSRARRRKIQRVRFIVCLMGLLGLALSQMSRMILNVGIADMTRKPTAATVLVSANASEHSALERPEVEEEANRTALLSFDEENNEEPTTTTTASAEAATATAAADIGDQAEYLSTVTTLDDAPTSAFPLFDQHQASSTEEAELLADDVHSTSTAAAAAAAATTPAHPEVEAESSVVVLEQADTAPIRFDWSNGQKNLLISSFYMGYAPCMMFGGSLANKYGTKYILFVSVFGSSIINMLTPSIAAYSFSLLIASRIALGLLQGGLVPSCYELFNKWLTATEQSIFAPMIKVSLAMGSFTGSLMPGVVAFLGYQWTCLFYTASLVCGLWSLVWYPLATSTPQTNAFVSPKELRRIVRKKAAATQSIPLETMSVVSVVQNNNNNTSSSSNSDKLYHLRAPPAAAATQAKAKPTKAKTPKQQEPTIPWLLILTNPSVLALALVKITYNIGMDFFGLELAIYLQQVHNAPTETISAIASTGCVIQMALITFVAWLAGDVVRKAKFGLSRTKWRKIFQGISNFSMALIYFMLPLAGDNLTIITVLVVLIFFFWIFAAGGESMVPYDMSTRYPATIVGITHSVSILSGLGVPLVCSLVLGDDSRNPTKWNHLFVTVGSGLAIGGLVFTLVLKAKPFLPEEMMPLSQQHKAKKGEEDGEGGAANGRQEVKLIVEPNEQIIRDHRQRY